MIETHWLPQLLGATFIAGIGVGLVFAYWDDLVVYSKRITGEEYRAQLEKGEKE